MTPGYGTVTRTYVTTKAFHSGQLSNQDFEMYFCPFPNSNLALEEIDFPIQPLQIRIQLKQSYSKKVKNQTNSNLTLDFETEKGRKRTHFCLCRSFRWLLLPQTQTCRCNWAGLFCLWLRLIGLWFHKRIGQFLKELFCV